MRDTADTAHRLLPVDPDARAIAHELLGLVEKFPIVSPHGHVDVDVIAGNASFADPSSIFVSSDHYVTRLIHSSGVDLATMNAGNATGAPSREVWRTLCENWDLFDGTASGYWITQELRDVFSLSERLSAEIADESFDRISALLARPEYRPRALVERFGIEFLATTDDALDDLNSHALLAKDPSFTARVAPTFRPDAYLDPASTEWQDRVERLLASGGPGTTGYSGYLDALRARRAHFIANGAVSADHGVADPTTIKLDDDEAARIFDRAMRKESTADEDRLFLANMLYQMAKMSVEDGLVMTIHAGVYRNHHPGTLERFGPDTGHDIPVPTSFTRGLRPLLADFGTARDFHLVLFTVDETAWSRELGPLAGFYPAVYLGAPWWFLDAPDAMYRWRSAVTETAGFSRSSGFIDDTRGFCSIPARHDAARRVEASFLSRLVIEGRLTMSRAAEIIVDIVDAAPRRVFKL